MRTTLTLIAALLAAPAGADGLQLPDPAPDAAVILPCAMDQEKSIADRASCGQAVFETCRTETEAAHPDEHWRVTHAFCIEREQRAWDAILNQTYRDLRPRADASGLGDALKDVQRRWIAYRDAKCAWKDPILAGNNAAFDGLTCMNDMTARRALELLTDLQYFP